MTNHQNGLTEEEIDKQIHYPMFDLLLANAKYRMKQRFKDYGNSWEDVPCIDMNQKGRQWWNDRLSKEVQEVIDAKSDGERAREIEDVVAILAMMHTNCRKDGDFIWNDSWWRYP